MKLTSFQRAVLRRYRNGSSPDAVTFNNMWFATRGNAQESYEKIMDIKSPLIDRVRVHLIAQTLIGKVE